jgi:hypothetical protein
MYRSMNRPDSTSESRVERLLKAAANWEPDHAMPENLIWESLRPAPKRSVRWVLALPACGAALAGVLAIAVMRPEVPGNLPPVRYETPERQLSELPVVSTPQPPVFTPKRVEAEVPVRVVSVVRPKRSRRREPDAPSRRKRVQPRRSRPDARVRHRTQETLVSPNEELQTASYQYVSEQKPLPKDAISLDESPNKIVPVVVAEPDEETGGVRLHAGAASVPPGDDEISLE